MSGLRILLVDDDVEFADSTADSLRMEQHDVSIARDGASAVALGRELKPDVVLLDLGLPDEDGYVVARALRRELPKTTPIIIVTGLRAASGSNEDIDLTLNKPIERELFGSLVEYVRRRRLGIVAPAPR